MTSPGVVLVTGAASGIGRAIADDLQGWGWRTVGVDLAPTSGCDLAEQADVTDEPAMARVVARAERELGPVTAAVSVAGHYEMTPLTEVTDAQWDRMLRVHLGGLTTVSRSVLPGMLERGSGSIVAITSELAIGGGDGDSHYAAAKGAIIGLVRSLAVEMAPRGVRVNAVAPGPTETPLLAEDSPWREPEYLATLPVRRLVQPGEVARCVRYLVEEGSFSVGEVISPNSGAVI